MRPVVIFLLLAGAGIVAWLVLVRPTKKNEAAKHRALAVSKHSADFNAAVAGTLRNYETLAERLVHWDSAAVRATAQTLAKDLEGVRLEELKKDSAGIYETAQAFVESARGEVQTVADAVNIRPQREAFNNLTDHLRQFLNTVHYDREKIYLQECPMAFDDTQAGQWLSKQPGIRNPYLGLHHPTYGKAMLSCGETKQTINHTGNSD